MAGIQYGQVAGPTQVATQTVLPQSGLQVNFGEQSPIRTAHDFMGPMRADFGEALPAFLGGIIDQHREARAAENRWQGFSDAVVGMTAEEIRDKQPWYAKMFGPTNYEAGAIMYGAQKKVNDMAADWQQRMPELREYDADTVKTMWMEQAKGLIGGNTFENAVVTQSLETSFAGFMSQHTKERVALQQGRLAIMQVDANASASTAFQMLSRNAALLGDAVPMDIAAAEALEFAKRSLEDTLVTGHHQNDESAQSFVNAAFRGAVRRGDFYSVNVMIDAGMLDAMPPEQAERLERLVQSGQEQARSRLASDNPEFQGMLDELNTLSRFGVGSPEMQRMIGKVDGMWSAITGARVPYLTDKQRSELMAGDASSYIRRSERAEDRQNTLGDRLATERAKAEAEAAGIEQNITSFHMGNLGQRVAEGGTNATQADQDSLVAFSGLVSQGKLNEAGGLLISGYNNMRASYKNARISEQLQTNLLNSVSDTITPAFEANYQMFRSLYHGMGGRVEGGEYVKNDAAQGRATAEAYYGKQLYDKLVRFDNMTEQGMGERAYAATFGQMSQMDTIDFRGSSSEETKAASTEFAKVVDQYDAGWLSRQMGTGLYAMHPSSRLLLTESVGPKYGSMGGGLQPTHKAQAAINSMFAETGAEYLGGHLLFRANNQTRLSEYIGDREGSNMARTSDLLTSALAAKLKEANITDNVSDMSVVFYRLGDDGGVPTYSVEVRGSKGLDYLVVTGDDLRAQDKRAVETKSRADAAVNELRNNSNAERQQYEQQRQNTFGGYDSVL